jgi:hypothetical protein
MESALGTTPHQRSISSPTGRGTVSATSSGLLQAPQCSPAGGSVHSITRADDAGVPLGPAPSSHHFGVHVAGFAWHPGLVLVSGIMRPCW